MCMCVFVNVCAVRLRCMEGHFDSFLWFCIELSFGKHTNKCVLVVLFQPSGRLCDTITNHVVHIRLIKLN